MEVIVRKSIEETKNEIIKYWNEDITYYPLNEKLVLKRFIEHKDVCESFSLMKGSEYVGSLILKKSLRGDKYQLYISFIFVRKEFRGFGIGSSLIEVAKDKQRELGLEALIVGSDYGCFESGLYNDDNKFVHDFFINRGFNHIGDTLNLINNKKIEFAPRTNYTYTHLEEKDRCQFGEFLRSFGLRWYNENKDADSNTAVILKDKDKIIAFAICSAEDSNVYNNGMNRYQKYKNDGIELGAIGPLGVDKEYRKQGLGKEIVQYGMMELYKRGCDQIIVDWTHLIDFYKKCGFNEICDTYEMYEYKEKEDLNE